MSAALPTHPVCRTVLTLATAVGLMMGVIFGQVQKSSRVTLPPPFATPSATNFPTVIAWPKGGMPSPPLGFSVDLLAAELQSPRWLYVLPNNDVLIAQASTEKPAKIDPATLEAMRKARIVGRSPNQITLCATVTATAASKRERCS